MDFKKNGTAPPAVPAHQIRAAVTLSSSIWAKNRPYINNQPIRKTTKTELLLRYIIFRLLANLIKTHILNKTDRSSSNEQFDPITGFSEH